MADKETMVEVRLQPGARNNKIVGFKDEHLYVKVTAQPRKGEANRALLELVAQTLAVPRNALDLVRGHTSRNKVIAIRGLSAEELQQRLALAEKDSFQR